MHRGGSQAPCQQRGLKKLPEAFCQLEADAKRDFLILGQGREFPGLLSPYVICFHDHRKLPWSLEACVQSASSACQPPQSDKEISASSLLFSFSLHCIRRILLFSALFQEQPEEYVVRCKSRQVHTTEPVFYTLPHFIHHPYNSSQILYMLLLIFGIPGRNSLMLFVLLLFTKVWSSLQSKNFLRTQCCNTNNLMDTAGSSSYAGFSSATQMKTFQQRQSVGR